MIAIKQGWIAAVVGIVVLAGCLLLAQTIEPDSTRTRVLREGLVIGGRVAI